MYVFPIDLLHLEQMGCRLEMSVEPPLDSGTLWPHSKLKTFMMVVHHATKHLCLYVSPK